MTTYLLLYKADPSAVAAMPQPTPEQAEEMNKAWMDWAASAGDAVKDFGNPTKAVSAGADDWVGGYSIIEADSADDVEALLTNHPHRAMGGVIDVYEAMAVPGM
jgi:hypothetical protein